MKFGPVTKLDKAKKTTSKTIEDGIMSAIVMSLLFFRFMADLKLFGSRILDA